MSDIRGKAQVFSAAVREWVGDSPTKATAFGGVCAVIGYLANIWPL